jgi:hypothetical protein
MLLTSGKTDRMPCYIHRVETQENINSYLNQKANGEKYSWNEYTKSLKFFDLQRNALESELPKLNSLYSVVLKNNNETESAATKERVNENELAEYVVSMYLSELESNFDNIFASLIDLGFHECDFKDRNWMKYDIILCGLTIDGMALFNLLDESQANRIFNYISVEKFMGLDSDYQRDYSIDQISKYKNIWNNSIKQSEIPLDYVFSKLYKDLLGENMEKYNISPLHMMQIMSVVMPIFAGKWKNVLESYEPTIE